MTLHFVFGKGNLRFIIKPEKLIDIGNETDRVKCGLPTLHEIDDKIEKLIKNYNYNYTYHLGYIDKIKKISSWMILFLMNGVI